MLPILIDNKIKFFLIDIRSKDDGQGSLFLFVLFLNNHLSCAFHFDKIIQFCYLLIFKMYLSEFFDDFCIVSQFFSRLNFFLTVHLSISVEMVGVQDLNITCQAENLSNKLRCFYFRNIFSLFLGLFIFVHI